MTAKTKVTSKNRVRRSSQDVAIDRLYKAVAAYVKSRGGNVAVIGGVQVQKWPGDLKFNWTLGIRCTGQRPLYSVPDGEKDA